MRAFNSAEGSDKPAVFQKKSGPVVKDAPAGVEIFNRGSCGSGPFIEFGRGRKGRRFGEVSGFGRRDDLEGQLSSRLAVDSAFKNPVALRRTVGQGHSPETGEARLRGAVIEAGHGSKLATGATHAAFAVVDSFRTVPLEVDDDF